jgi:hypothetical protein
MKLEIVDVDGQLRTDSLLWSALHGHGRERRLEGDMLKGIDDLLDLRLELMKEQDEVPKAAQAS